MAAGFTSFMTGAYCIKSALIPGTIRPLKKQHVMLKAITSPVLAPSPHFPMEPMKKPMETPMIPPRIAPR